MNRREKEQFVIGLADQYHRASTEEFSGGIYTPDYRLGWKDAVRSMAVSAGVYDAFIAKLEKVG